MNKQPSTLKTETSDNGVPPKLVRYEGWVIVGILLIGALLRLLFLGRCKLWQDEMGFIVLADPKLSLGEVLQQSWALILSIGQQPLGFVLQNLYMKMISPLVPDVMFNPFWARMHWLLWGLAGLAGVYFMVRQISGRLAATLTMFLFAVSLFPIFYAREVYPYAGVMASAAWFIYFAYRHLFSADRPWKWALGAGISGFFLVYLHLNGVLFFGIASVVIGVLWLKEFLFKKSADRSILGRQANRLILVLVLVGLAVSPYFLRFVLFNKAHTQGSPFSIWSILQDPVAKFFLGEQAWALAAGWIMLLVGTITIMRRRTAPGLMLLITGLVVWLFIGYSTSRSQYLSARYFAPLTPVFYWIFAEGVLGFCRLVRREKMAVWLAAGLAIVYAAVHLFVYLPGLYALRDKDTGFGKIADWLNENLEPGTPYLMESAYEMRWVGGYHKTPGLTGAAPYVHMAGPGELDRLHQRQIAFMQQFPEAPFIQSAHHNWDTPEGIWPWPREYHARHVRLWNNPLRDLIDVGIFPSLPMEKVHDHSYNTDIFYSTREDRLEKAAQSGVPALFHYPEWTVGGQQVNQLMTEYFRIAPGARSVVKVTRVADAPVTMDLMVTLAVISEAPSESVTLVAAGQSPVRYSLTPGQFAQIPVRGVLLDQPEITLEIRHRGSPVRALLLRDIQARRVDK